LTESVRPTKVTKQRIMAIISSQSYNHNFTKHGYEFGTTTLSKQVVN